MKPLSDSNPSVFSIEYDLASTNLIKQNFEADPKKYSQDFGNLLLWKLHKMNNILGNQMAKLPDLSDGIDVSEAKALGTIYNYAKNIDFPPDYGNKEIDISDHFLKAYIYVLWGSDKEDKYDVKIRFLEAQKYNVKVNIASYQTEKEDKFYVPQGYDIGLISSVRPGDNDGIQIMFRGFPGASFVININNEFFTVRVWDLEYNKPLMLSKNLEVGLLQELTKPKTLSVMIESMIGDAYKHDRNRYSPFLEAFFWWVLDGKFNAEDFPRVYNDKLSFIKMVWGSMLGPRWKTFNRVVNRLNTPELLDYYINRNFKYEHGKNQTSQDTFFLKNGQCISLAVFGEHVLKKAGYKTFIRSVKWGIDPYHDDHTGSGVILENGSYLLVIDFGPSGNRISGPYNSIDLVDKQLARGRKIISKMWGHKVGPWY
ncbi:MAG: hypothetical protein FJ115_03615 [Deltaproteobacteria bacterium]|nr:hypothetical protein [Deltaproteobacteria bacterium]